MKTTRSLRNPVLQHVYCTCTSLAQEMWHYKTGWAICLRLFLCNFSVTHSEVWSTLDDEAVSKAVQPDCTTLLVQVHLLLRQEMSNPAACTQPSK